MSSTFICEHCFTQSVVPRSGRARKFCNNDCYYQHTHGNTPKFTNCKQCNKQISIKNKFCSKSCSAAYNNIRRNPRTEESKKKTSVTVLNNIKNGIVRKSCPPVHPLIRHTYTRLYGRYKCHACQIDFWQTKRDQKCCSKECRDMICSQNKCRKTHISYFSKHENKLIDLQSTWELSVAIWLDANGVIWSRPSKRITWHCNTLHKDRSYLPDFYIISHNYYIDVKNPIKIQQDADKLSQLIKIIPLFVGNIEQSINFVAQLIGLEPTCIH